MRLFRYLAVLLVALAAVSCATPSSPIEQSGQSEEPMVATGPSANEYYVRAGEAWDDPDRALSDYSRAIELDPDFALAYFARARTYRGAGDPQAAVRDYDAAIARDPGLVQAYRERGEVRMWDLDDKDGVDDFLMGYELDPDDLSTALAYAGLIAWDDPATAASIYDRMVELHPNRSDSYLARAKFQRDRGHFAAAIRDFRIVLESGNREPWLRAELVMLQLATGDAAAAAAAESLAREYPDSSEAMLVRARSAALSGKVGEARRFYEPYFNDEWADPRVWLELAFVHAAGGDDQSALDAIERYSGEKGDVLGARVARAGAALLLGDEQDAIGTLESILRDDSWYQPVWVMLAAAEPGAADRVPTIDVAGTYFAFNPDMWVWMSLFLIANPDATVSAPLP